MGIIVQIAREGKHTVTLSAAKGLVVATTEMLR